MKYYCFLLCLFLQSKVSVANLENIASHIVTEKVVYYDKTLKTNDASQKEKFYLHIAEQHFGIGVNSYARYSEQSKKGENKVLRSQFILNSNDYPQFDSQQKLVKQAACCVWFKDIFDAYMKKTINEIQSGITKLLARSNDLKEKSNSGMLTKEDEQSALQKIQLSLISPYIKQTITNFQGLKAQIEYYLPIIKALFDCDDDFLNNGGGKTDKKMRSVFIDLNNFFNHIDQYILICQKIDEDNGTFGATAVVSTLTLEVLDTLVEMHLLGVISKLTFNLKLLEKHVDSVKKSFSNVSRYAQNITKVLFEDVLNNGYSLKGYIHKPSSINLYYSYPNSKMTMKAENNTNCSNSSWYDSSTQQLLDNRETVKTVLIAFQVENGELFYGTMYPVID